MTTPFCQVNQVKSLNTVIMSEALIEDADLLIELILQRNIGKPDPPTTLHPR